MREEFYKAKTNKQEYAVVESVGKMYGDKFSSSSDCLFFPSKINLLMRREYSLISPKDVVDIRKNLIKQKYCSFSDLPERLKQEWYKVDNDPKMISLIPPLNETRGFLDHTYNSFDNLYNRNFITDQAVMHLSPEDAVRFGVKRGFVLLDESPIINEKIIPLTKRILRKIKNTSENNIYAYPERNELEYVVNTEEARDLFEKGTFFTFDDYKTEKRIIREYLGLSEKEVFDNYGKLELNFTENKSPFSYVTQMHIGDYDGRSSVIGRNYIFLSASTIGLKNNIAGVKKEHKSLKNLEKKENVKIFNLLKNKGLQERIHEYDPIKEEEDRADFLYKLSPNEDVIIPSLCIPRFDNYYEFAKTVVKKGIDKKFDKEALTGAILKTYLLSQHGLAMGFGVGWQATKNMLDIESKKIVDFVSKGKNKQKLTQAISEIYKIMD